jgi:hypothetical protein
MSLYLNESEDGTMELEMSVVGQTQGMEIKVVDGVPILSYGGEGKGDEKGKWWVCREPAGLKGEDQMVLNWGEGLEECEAVVIVAVCANLVRLPQGALGSHAFAMEVSCLEGVAGEDE